MPTVNQRLAAPKEFDLATYDFVIVIEFKDSSGNGNPDNFNAPRQSDRGHALITGESFRQRIRKAILRLKEGEAGYDILHRRGIIREDLVTEAYKDVGALKKSKGKGPDEIKGNAALCAKYFDVRTFGLVLNKPGKGHVRGPVTIHLGQSVYPVLPEELSITNVTTASQKTSAKNNGYNQGFGRKSRIPHAVVPFTGSIDAKLAQETGFNEDDLATFIEGAIKAYALNPSQSLGHVTIRKFYMFKHSDPNRNCQPSTAYELVDIQSPNGEESTSWKDYQVTLSKNIPHGLEVIEIPVA